MDDPANWALKSMLDSMALSLQPPIGVSRMMHFSRINNPDTWDCEPPEVAPFAFASHEDAVKAAALFNKLLEERDALIAALRVWQKRLYYSDPYNDTNMVEALIGKLQNKF